MAQHNLGTVIGFEFIRTITKARFWIGTLSVPVIMAIVFGLIFASNTRYRGRLQRPGKRRNFPRLHRRLRPHHRRTGRRVRGRPRNLTPSGHRRRQERDGGGVLRVSC